MKKTIRDFLDIVAGIIIIPIIIILGIAIPILHYLNYETITTALIYTNAVIVVLFLIYYIYVFIRKD